MSTNKSKIASFDVDAQIGFTPLSPDELPVPGGDEIVGDLNFMASLAGLRIGSKDAHSPQAVWVVDSKDQMFQPLGLPNADITWVSHCVPGTAGFELLPGLPAEDEYDYFIWKGASPSMHPYGACFHDLKDKLSTGVIEWLKIKGVEKVIVGGLAFDYCVKTTAIQLAKAGFTVIVYMPATRAIADDSATSALNELVNTPNILVASDRNELTAFAA
ncbi:nicotinamidase [Pseudomonas aeruginosa]